MTEKHTGSCLCGGVAYTVTGPLRPVIACHCEQCRKTSGHFVAATSAPFSAVSFIRDGTLTWYASSDRAKRGFCSACGGNLFWKPLDEDRVSIMAGTLDPPTGLSISHHIHVEDASDYHDVPGR